MKKTTYKQLPLSIEDANPLFNYISADPETVRKTLKNILDERYEIRPERKYRVFYLRFNGRTVEALDALLRAKFRMNLIPDQCHITVFERYDFIAPTRGSASNTANASTQSHITFKYNPFNSDEEKTIRIYYDNNWKEILVDCRESNKDEILCLLRANPTFKLIENSMRNLIGNMHETHFAALTMRNTTPENHRPAGTSSLASEPITEVKIDNDLLEKCQVLIDSTIKQPQVNPMLFFATIFPSDNSLEHFISIFIPSIDKDLAKEYVNDLVSSKNHKEIREVMYNKLSELNAPQTVLESYRDKLDGYKPVPPRNRWH